MVPLIRDAIEDIAVEDVDEHLGPCIYRRKVKSINMLETKEGVTLAANREKEIATRLKDRARATLEEWRENKLAALPRYRRMQRTGEG